MTFSIKYLGKENKELLNEISKRVTSKISNQSYTEDEIKCIKDFSVKILNNNVNISKKSLEQIRFLCQWYDNRLNPINMISHRKYIGKFITLAKKIVYRFTNFALKNYINQQNEFNAGVIKTLISLENDKTTKNIECKKWYPEIVVLEFSRNPNLAFVLHFLAS